MRQCAGDIKRIPAAQAPVSPGLTRRLEQSVVQRVQLKKGCRAQRRFGAGTSRGVTDPSRDRTPDLEEQDSGRMNLNRSARDLAKKCGGVGMKSIGPVEGGYPHTGVHGQ